MSGNTSKKTKYTAISSMLAALSVVILYLGSVFNVFDLTAVAFSSIIILFAVNELKMPYSLEIYGVTGILSLILLPDKFAAVAYILIGGVYPLLRTLFEKFPKIISLLLKLLYFNIVLTGLLAASMFILNIQDEELGFNLITYVLGNAVFFFFDFFISIFQPFYDKILRKKFGIDKLMK